MMDQDSGKERLRRLVETLPDSDAIVVEAFIRFLAWQRHAGGESGGSMVAWLDSCAEGMADGVAVAEQGVAADDLRHWLDAVEASVKPL